LNAEVGQVSDADVRHEIVKLRRSRRRLIEAADADRRAMERALHDGVQQHLVALAVELRQVASLVERDPAAAKGRIDDMRDIVRQALGEATALAAQIYPPFIDVRGLGSALRAAAERAGVTLTVDTRPRASYPPVIVSAVYSSCFEALSSASGGSEARIKIGEEDGSLTFEVEIDGHPDDERRTRLADRIEALDGEVTVRDDEGGRSIIHGSLPVAPRA
jgi:signal transduction histidine kinase